MIKSRVAFFCKFPPPYTGQAVGTEIFADMLTSVAEVERVDTSMDTIRPEPNTWKYFNYYARFVWRLVRKYRELNQILRRESIQGFYYVASPSTMGHLKDIAGLKIARPFVDRAVAHLHNGNFQEIFNRQTTHRTASWLMRNTDLFIFSSRELSNRAAPYIPESKRTVVHNTVDKDVRCGVGEVEAKISARRQRTKMRILYLSNMIPSKGYMDVAKAISFLSISGQQDVQVDFVGDWPDQGREQQFNQFIQKEELDRVIRVHGRVTDRSRIKEMLLESDVFVLPTYYPNEAQPFAIVEALNAATPIVSTRHASIPEYVKHNQNGYLVDKKAPHQIARAIESFRGREKWERAARAARATYEMQFASEAVKQQLFNAFAQAGLSVPC